MGRTIQIKKKTVEGEIVDQRRQGLFARSNQWGGREDCKVERRKVKALLRKTGGYED
jgi:hypothetical protein